MSPTAIQQAIDVATAAAIEADREHAARIASIESALGRKLLALATAAVVEAPVVAAAPPVVPTPTPDDWSTPTTKPVKRATKPAPVVTLPPPVDGHPAGCPCSVCVLPF